METVIYLDNAATTRPNARAVSRAQAFLDEKWYNPSALYAGGEGVKREIKGARESLLSRIADPAQFELTFTSCGTEADDQAIFCGARRGNAVTTSGEHAAVNASFRELKNRGVEPRFAPSLQDGRVDEEALLSLVDEKTSLVSVVHVASETGAVNDIFRLAALVKKKNPRCLVMSDGVQAFGKLPVRLTKDIDLYTVSAHKIGGVKGTGALIRKKTLTPFTYLYGGGQEGGVRSGTENVFGIMCFAYAAEDKFSSLQADGARARELREALFSALDRDIFARISPEEGSPYILTVSARGLRGAVLQQLLSRGGVYVGTGSACSSKKPFSAAIEACGYREDVLYGVLRMSLSPQTTREEVLACAAALNEEARAMKGRL